MDYEEKYLKYKSKYFKLKNQIGGTLEVEEAREINEAFPRFSTFNTTQDQILNILYMSRFLNLYKKENFHLINETKIINRLLTYLTNYDINTESQSVRNIIDDNYIFLLESLIVIINNSDFTKGSSNFFYISSDSENMTSLLTYISLYKKPEKYVKLTLKLIDAIFDKMMMIDGRLYNAHAESIFIFIVATIIYLKNNILFEKTSYSIDKVKNYIIKLKSKNMLNIIAITQDKKKLTYPNISDAIEAINLNKLNIDDLLQEFFF